MMHLTTKGRYAARIMVYLARHDPDQSATKKAIGESEDISPDYVEQIMIRLKASALVRSHRGRHGGFSLTRNPDKITLAEVLHAVEGPVAPVPCLHERCERESSCPTRPVWKQAAKALNEIFAGTTIGQMAMQPAGDARAGDAYQI